GERSAQDAKHRKTGVENRDLEDTPTLAPTQSRM
ncbi:MAG: hypothetical protein ACI82G_000760, partial [Bradymonadia bacterium]